MAGCCAVTEPGLSGALDVDYDLTLQRFRNLCHERAQPIMLKERSMAVPSQSEFSKAKCALASAAEMESAGPRPLPFVP